MFMLSVPTDYPCTFLPGRKRTPDTAYLRTSVNIGIPITSNDEAPIVHSVANLDRHEQGMFDPFGSVRSGGIPIRSLNGRLYAQRCRADDIVDIIADGSHDNPFDGFVRGHDGQFVSIGLVDSSSTGRDYCRSREDAESVHGSIRGWTDHFEAVANMIAERARLDLLVVDGWIHEVVGEPVLVVEHDPIAPEVANEAIRIRIYENRHPHTPFTRSRSIRCPFGLARFGLDEKERAVAHASEMAERIGCPVIDHTIIDLVSPWCVRFRGDGERLLQAAHTISCHGSDGDHGRLLAMVRPQFGLSWHDLASSLVGTLTITPPAIDAIRRLDAMGQAGHIHHPGPYRHDYAHNPDRLEDNLRMLSEALRSWDARENCGLEWIEAGLNTGATYDDAFKATEVLSVNEADILSEALGESVGDLADAAARGAGSLIRVDDRDGPTAAIFIPFDVDADDTYVGVTRHRAAPSPQVLDIAFRHVREAPPRLDAMDTSLAELGI